MTVSLDPWNWGATARQIDQAEAQRMQAEDVLAQQKDEVSLDVKRAYISLLRIPERIALTRQGVAAAEENYRVGLSKFKLGVTPSAQLMDAESTLLQAKMNHTRSLVDYETASAGLDRATGQE